MKEDKEVRIGGKIVNISQIKHWDFDESLDRPEKNDLNQRRWEVFNMVLQAWRALDPAVFKEILSDNFTYSSDWVLETMRGPKQYQGYIKGKFNAIRQGGGKPTLEIVTIRQALYPQIYSYALQMTQGKVQTLLTFDFEGEWIKQMCMKDPDTHTFEPYKE